MAKAQANTATMMAIDESDEENDNDMKENDGNEDEPWGSIKMPTPEWKMVSKEVIDSCKPFQPDDVFNDNALSVHGLAALGEKVLKISPGSNATIVQWEGLIWMTLDKGESFHNTPNGTKLRDFAVRLAKTGPKQLFDDNLWKGDKLVSVSVTTPWKAAYNVFGAKWAVDKYKTFEEYFKWWDDVKSGPKDNVYLHLPLEQPSLRNAMFNTYNRRHITFVKFKTPQFDGTSRIEREKEFIDSMIEMLQTVWEMDPSVLLIPWEATSKARAIKKSTTKMPNTSDGWRLYTDCVFLRKDSRCWPRMRLAHDLDPDFLENDDLVEAFKNNDTFLQKEAIQVYQSAKVGWFLGSHYLAFNTEIMKKSLEMQPGFQNIPIHLKTEFIKTDPRTPGTVKAIHIYTEHEKAYRCRTALAKLYAAGNEKNYPLGKNIRFIPDITDTRFITTEKTKMRIQKCIAKQKLFLDNAATGKNYTIIGLDNYINVIGVTMRQAIMGLRSVSQKDRNLFLAVDKQATTNTVVFAYHKDLESEANTAIAALPLILEWNYDNVIWKWFTDEARETADGFKYDPNNGITEVVQSVNMEWNVQGEDNIEDIEEVIIEGTGNFRINTNERGRSELRDGGSTVGSWGSAIRKRKINDGSVSSSITGSSVSVSVIDQFDHLLLNDPTFRAQVLQRTASMHGNSSLSTAGTSNNTYPGTNNPGGSSG